MQTPFNGTEQIGALVAGFPGASNVLKAYGIDFCCGGNRSLQTAITQQKLNQDEVLLRLNVAYREDQERQETDRNWQDTSFQELITHIVETHHDFLREELPVISGFLTKILRVHGPHEPEKLGHLHQLFHTMKSELDEHLIAEEEGQFPLILSYETNPSSETLEQAKGAIRQLEDEHAGVGELLKAMRVLTQDYSLPEWACRTYTLAFQKLEALESDLFQHIHLENNILFPRIERLAAGEDCGCSN